MQQSTQPIWIVEFHDASIIVIAETAGNYNDSVGLYLALAHHVSLCLASSVFASLFKPLPPTPPPKQLNPA